MPKTPSPLLNLNRNLNPFRETGEIKSKSKIKIKTGTTTEVNHA